MDGITDLMDMRLSELWEMVRDKEAWRAAIYGVAKSRTRLSDVIFMFTFTHWRRAWQPTPVSLPGEPPWAEEPGGLPSMGRTESDTTEAT